MTSLVASYCGPPPDPAALIGRWNDDPVLLAAMALIAGAQLYWLRPDSRQQWRCFALGWGALGLAFVSPLCAASAALFSARVVHHLVLVAIAAPLLARAIRLPVRLPLSAVAFAHMAIFWFWHAPPAYATAFGSVWVYWLMQLSLLASAALFWLKWRAATQGQAVSAALTLVAVASAMALLGAIITFAPAALYSPHATTTLAWHLTPLEDQQLAGLIMWVPGALPYALALIMLARKTAPRWLGGAPA